MRTIVYCQQKRFLQYRTDYPTSYCGKRSRNVSQNSKYRKINKSHPYKIQILQEFLYNYCMQTKYQAVIIALLMSVRLFLNIIENAATFYGRYEAYSKSKNRLLIFKYQCVKTVLRLQRSVIKFLCAKRSSADEIHQEVYLVHRPTVMSS